VKTLSPLLLCLCAVLVASPQSVRADDTTPPSQAPPSDGSNADAVKAQRQERIREAFAQLDLTDDQKQQIREIRQTVTDIPERRRQIWAVLTPEQKQKLIELLPGFRNSGAAATTPAETPAAPASSATTTPGTSSSGAGDGSDLAPGAN